MKTLQIQFVPEKNSYTGSELRSHFIYERFNLLGDAAIAFAGPCEVKLSEMVDLEDVKAKAPIYSENMLHFLIEHFHTSLEVMVLRQRLLIAILQQELRSQTSATILRRGDDLYEGEAKLSVSIATLSPVSGLIHTGINISSKNTPVRTKGLEDYKIDPQKFAEKILSAYQKEIESMSQAACKVRPVS